MSWVKTYQTLRPFYLVAKFLIIFVIRFPIRVHYLNQIMATVLPGKWYSFQDICALGYPKNDVRDILLTVTFSAEAIFDARLSPDVVAAIPEHLLREHGFDELSECTIHRYEFCLAMEDPAPNDPPDAYRYYDLGDSIVPA